MVVCFFVDGLQIWRSGFHALGLRFDPAVCFFVVITITTFWFLYYFGCFGFRFVTVSLILKLLLRFGFQGFTGLVLVVLRVSFQAEGLFSHAVL